MVKRFLEWLISRYSLEEYLIDKYKLNRVNECNKFVMNEGAVFYPEAKVENLSHNNPLIRLGLGSHIRSNLLICNFGGSIIVGENCYLGEGTRIWSGASIIVGNNFLISHNVNIIDTNSHELISIERAERYTELIENGHWSDKGAIVVAPIVIEDYAWISFNTTVLKGVRIGKGAIVAANSVVTKDVPDYTTLAGNPARVVRYTT